VVREIASDYLIPILILKTGGQVFHQIKPKRQSCVNPKSHSQKTTPLLAVHLAIDTGLEEDGKGARVKAYIRSVHLAILPQPPLSFTKPKFDRNRREHAVFRFREDADRRLAVE
jgi:hypothetical protein